MTEFGFRCVPWVYEYVGSNPTLPIMVNVTLSEEEAEALLEGGRIEIVSANLGRAGRNGKVTIEVENDGESSKGSYSVRTREQQR